MLKREDFIRISYQPSFFNQTESSSYLKNFKYTGHEVCQTDESK